MITQTRLREEYRYDDETGAWSRPRVVGSRGRMKGGRSIGRMNAQGYVIITIDGRDYRASRLAFLYMTGRWPEHEAEHKNLDKADNRWCNLREATHAENMRNVKMRKHNKSGFKGVTWRKRNRRWEASIRAGGKLHHLGLFDDPAAAHAAYCKAAAKHFGEFARMN